MKQKHGFRILVALSVFALAIYTLWPTYQVLSQPQDFDKPIAEQRRSNFIKENPNIATKAMQLGLDLAGGTHIIVEIDESSLNDDEKRDVTDRCLEILRNRVDQFGLSEPILSKSGDYRIVAELAGLDADAARRLIGATALLEFKLLGEASDFDNTVQRIDGYLQKISGLTGDSSLAAPAKKDELTSIFGDVVTDPTKETAAKIGETKTDSISDTSKVAASDTLLSDSSKVALTDSAKTDSAKEDSADTQAALSNLSASPFLSYLVRTPGGVGVRLENINKVKQILAKPEVKQLIPKRYQFLWGKEILDVQNFKVRELFFLKRRAEMTGEYVKDAVTQRAPTGEVEVALSFKGRGPKEFARITGANIKKRLAIVLDSVVYSAPTIQGKITQGRASITGIGEFKEAQLLSTTLRAGSLPAPMEIVELRSVGPTLGKENIEKGFQAALWGLVLVIVFMVAYYTGAGLIATLALVFNLALIGAVLSMAHATLTLPGIAGIILTIGMAVDANVIIFERIREELLLGKSVRGAIDAGYKRAFTTIFDSNITTFGTALILYNIGTGPIKGFGLTLMIGIAASMFTALYITRLVFDLFIEKVDVKSLAIGKGFGFLRKPNIRFIPNSKIFAICSITLIVVFAAAGVGLNRYNWSIDFTGGHVYQVKMNETPDVQAIRAKAVSAGLESPRVQSIGTVEDREILISIEKSANDSLIRAQVDEAIGATGKIIGEESVGPRIGAELKTDALLAFAVALVLIVLYIWVRFGKQGLGFGLGAVVALFHDVIITFTLFGLLGLEIDLTFVAAVLTIVGYSLNDTIVVFDRVRENIEVSGKEKFGQKVNNAINQSLARTLITSLTTFFVVALLVAFGGDGIKSFAWALLIGVFVGTYSSACIASPFVTWWEGRTGKVSGSKKA